MADKLGQKDKRNDWFQECIFLPHFSAFNLLGCGYAALVNRSPMASDGRQARVGLSNDC